MDLHLKIVEGLERLGEVFKTLLWQKAKLHGISPIQIQLLLFISRHSAELSNVSYLAKEFNVTKPTISDAVKTLTNKGYLEKDFSPTDSRRYNLRLSISGHNLVKELLDYALPVSSGLKGVSENELNSFFDVMAKLIYQLNLSGVIQVQRTCFGCKHYNGNREDKHHCKLLGTKLLNGDIRLDCPEYKEL